MRSLERTGSRMKRCSILAGLGLAACIASGTSTPISAQAAKGAAAREGYAELPAARIWYRDTGGSGVPVVFLHAGSGSSRNWEYQAPAVTAAGYRFIAYDRRGWGHSGTTPGTARPGTDADDLQGLMDYLGVDRFHLVGTASGGWVSIDYALSFQQRLRSLVIANSTGGLQDEEYLALVRRLLPPQFDTLPHDFLELGPAYRAADPEGTRRWNELEDLSRPDGQALTPQMMKNRATYSALETIRVPTLFLTGDADLYSPPPVLRLFTARIKDSALVIVPGAGHSAYWEQPDVFNRSVLEFIRKHSTD